MPHGQMPHDQMHGPMMTRAGIGAPASPGQDAFGTVAEIVRILDADPQTDSG